MLTQTTTFNGAHSNMKNSIDRAQDAHRVCSEVMIHCLAMGGKMGERDHIRLLLDCADMCEITANYMMRGSPLYRQICALCAQICDLCASQCEQFDDSLVRKCMESCKACAEMCQQMLH
jgi:hypothetical protein